MSKKPKVQSKQSKKAKTKAKYRVRNWADYNENLVQRGALTVWINDKLIEEWKPKPPKKRKPGAQPQYSDKAIECMMTLRAVFHLTLRQTEGFARSLFEAMEIDAKAPDYTTLCKRSVGLTVQLPSSSKDPAHIVLDSTGLKIYGEGERKVRKHGYSKRRTWRKLHLSVNSDNQEIEAVVLSEANLDDGEASIKLLEETQTPIDKLSADGAYDQRKVYQSCEKNEVGQINIPPRRNARIWQHGNSSKPPLPRDQNLRRIRAVGRKRWKEESAYHQRSLSETAMFRFKIIFGDHLVSRKIQQQITEARIKCLALNRMTQLGMPDSYLVV